MAVRIPWRLTKVWQKTVYIIGIVILGLALTALGLALNLQTANHIAWPYELVESIIEIAAVYLATRMFRTPGEPVEPPRAWWRATGAPSLGFLVAIVEISGLVVVLVPAFGAGSSYTPIELAVDAIGAAFYLHSSIRLVANRSLIPSNPGVTAAKGQREAAKPSRQTPAN